MMLFGSCSGHPPAARSPAALPPLPSGIWAVAHRVQQLKPFDWSRRRQLKNAVDDLGIDIPTFMLGDWRFTGMSICRHECNDPVTGLGTTGQCDEDTTAFVRKERTAKTVGNSTWTRHLRRWPRIMAATLIFRLHAAERLAHGPQAVLQWVSRTEQ